MLSVHKVSELSSVRLTCSMASPAHKRESIMGTYKQIIQWIKTNPSYGGVVKTCWIAHCKELAGLPVARASNRQGDSRMVECPREKRAAIFAAFHHFQMI